MINLERIKNQRLETDLCRQAVIIYLYTPDDAYQPPHRYQAADLG